MPGVLLNNTLTSLSGGVTEQYQEGRYETQVEEMHNCIPSITRGILRRNPLETLGKFGATNLPADLSDSFIYSYDRGTGDEQYIIVIPGDGYIHVFNANDSSHLYTNPVIDNYLVAAFGYKPKEIFKAITIGDHSFIVNTTITTAFTAAKAPSVGHEDMAFYWIKKTASVVTDQYQSGGSDTVSVGMKSVGYEYTLNGRMIRGEKDTRSTTTTDPDLDTANKIAAKFSNTANSLVTSVDKSVAYKINFTGADFTWGDTFGDEASLGVWKIVDDADKLPANLPAALDGFIVQVSGGTSAEFDDYFLKYSYDDRSWAEIPKPGVYTTLDPATMPHVLYRTRPNPVGSRFEFGEYKEVLDIYDSYSTTLTLAAIVALEAYEVATAERVAAQATLDEANVILAEHAANVTALDGVRLGIENTSFYGALQAVFLQITGDALESGQAAYDEAKVPIDVLETTLTIKITAEDIAETVSDAAQVAAAGGLLSTDTWLGASLWGKREAGGGGAYDDPTFIGNTISDIFFHKNRLGFLTGDSVVLSITAEYGNFFFQTVQNVLDDDPIDLAIASTDVNILRHAVSTAGTLLLFADSTQYSLSSVDNGPLTPESSTLVALSNYTYSNGAEAKAISNKVYFTNTAGRYSQLYTYRITNLVAGQTEATPMTTHLPAYISKDLEYLVGHDVLGYTFIKEKGGITNELVVLTTTASGKEDLQNAFHRWSFSKPFSSIHIINNHLCVVFDDGDFGKISLETPGSIADITYADTFSDASVSNYPSYIDFSEFFVRDKNGKGTVRGRYQLRTIKYTIEELSHYSTTLENVNDGQSYPRIYINDETVTVMGNSKKTKIRFGEDPTNQTKGFELATVNVEGFLYQRSTRG